MKLHRVISLAIVALVPMISALRGEAQPQRQPPTQEQMLQAWDQAKVWELNLSGLMPRGMAVAPLQVVEFADYLCGACRQLGEAWNTFLPTTGGQVVLYFKNYPLDSECNEFIKRQVHPGACWVALGSICAAEQKHFWEYNEAAFKAELKNPTADDIVDLGAKLGMNEAEMQGCLLSSDTMAKLKAEIQEAGALGVASTPTVFLNGKRLPSLEYFALWLQAEARKLGVTLPTAQQR